VPWVTPNVRFLRGNYRPLTITLDENLHHYVVARLPRGAVWVFVSSQSPSMAGAVAVARRKAAPAGPVKDQQAVHDSAALQTAG
jgi:hypothetical protein